MTSSPSYHLKVQAQGRVVLPSAIRTELQVSEGDEIIILKTAHGYEVTSRALLAQSILGSLKKSAGHEHRDYTQELLDERRAEANAKGW